MQKDKLVVTNEIVNVILPQLVHTHLEQHLDRCDASERHVIDLLVVGLQDELAKGAAAISVNLEGVIENKAR